MKNKDLRREMKEQNRNERDWYHAHRMAFGPDWVDETIARCWWKIILKYTGIIGWCIGLYFLVKAMWPLWSFE